MKKYYLAGTDEEIMVGDVITTECEKKLKDGRTITREVEFKVTEDFIPYALEMGILEEDEEDDELLDFDEEGFEEFKEAVAQDIDDLSDADAAMERRIAKLEEKVATLEELYRLLGDKKKTASSNKK